MAVRPVYAVKESAPFFEVVNVDFEWNGGFAKVQKQKNITAIHQAFSRRRPGKKVLEISSKSMQEGGEALSAFFLPKFVPELACSVPVECVFQAGKVFMKGGPYKELMLASPRDAKRDERLQTSGKLRCFTFDGKAFPLVPRTIFYDYIYIKALFENEDLAKIALAYDAFTDVEFNPEKSLNCQAKAAATFVSLTRMGLIDRVKDFDSFISLYGVNPANIKVDADMEQICSAKLSESQIADWKANLKKEAKAPKKKSSRTKTAKVSEDDDKVLKSGNAVDVKSIVETAKPVAAKPVAEAVKPIEDKVSLVKCEPVKEEKTEPKIKVGNTLKHKKYGAGVVKKVDATVLKVEFASVGEKSLALAWCLANCEIAE